MIIKVVFDLGIIYFDFVNNYGLILGSVEENFGWLLRIDLKFYCDELVIVIKVGYYMWEGFYGEWGFKKSIIVSVD